MKRMYSLDIMKLLLAYVVAFFHVGILIPPGPTVAVQIFFIISGFFLGKKFYASRSSEYNQWDYTLDHVKSLYPHYLFSMIVLFLYLTAREIVYLVKDPGWGQVGDLLLSVYNQIPDILLLQSAYHFHDSMNYPLWQISALLIAGYFVFGLLCHNEKLSRTLLFPAAILMIQSLLNTGVDLWANYGPFYMPLLRAFSPLCIGVLTYYFTTTPYWAKLRERAVFFNVSSILALVSIVAFGQYDIIFLITTPLVLLACCEEQSWINAVLNRRIFRGCGKMSYAVYLNHALIQRFLYAVFFTRLEGLGVSLNDYQRGAVYWVVLTAYSVFTLFLVEKLKNFFAGKSKAAVR